MTAALGDEPVLDVEAALAFLSDHTEGVDPDWFVTLWWGEDKSSRHVRVADVADRVPALLRASPDNVFAAMGLRRAAPLRGYRGGADTVDAITTLWWTSTSRRAPPPTSTPSRRSSSGCPWCPPTAW